MTITHSDLANSIRALSMDAVEKAKSGHVGLPLGMADVATILYTEFLKFDPQVPDWPDRDRFVLSAGHGSMLLYALMYLTGYDSVSLDEIMNFRQLGAKTPGHPENFITPGVETTTGPLGQGIATAVGMAMAERYMASRFGADLVDHKTWVLAGDGCLMEGVSQEAITLAGHQKLNKLIVLFDDNNVSIDGTLDLTDNTDQLKRFEASGWAVETIDGHDPESIRAALSRAQAAVLPYLIACKTRIGFGAPTLEGTGKAHGGPYGANEVADIRSNLNWPHEPFTIPHPILSAWRKKGARGRDDYKKWSQNLQSSPIKQSFERSLNGTLPDNLSQTIATEKKAIIEGGKKNATRKWSGVVLDTLVQEIPEMVGGSADLTGSNNTKAKDVVPMTPDRPGGRFIHYGIREHGMAAAMNGMALHGGVIPFSGTFFVFSDYSRAALRIGALMGERVVHVMTHDSIGLGEDGPTHQPVEHLAAMRAMPNMHVFRPADGVEVAECWELALRRAHGPSVVCLTRQGVDNVRNVHTNENLSAKGAYVLRDAAGAKATLLATGSEVGLAVQAHEELAEQGILARVVSMPCWEVFEAQNSAYRTSVLGSVPRIAIEAGVRFGWDRYLGPSDNFIGMTGFGASAPATDLYTHFNITVDAIVEAVKGL